MRCTRRPRELRAAPRVSAAVRLGVIRHGAQQEKLTRPHAVSDRVRRIRQGTSGGLDCRSAPTVLASVATQLVNEPQAETRNRKPLRPNPVAPWELRVGKLRVFYDMSEGPPQTVRVLAVGVKDRNILRIGGEEIQL